MWKYVLFKKGNNLDASIYIPVSILSSMSKIFEKEIVNQMSVYFENVFSPSISGFRQRNSCETVLLPLIENIKKSIETGKVVCVVLMNLSRAFDCIPYKLFISKLRAYMAYHNLHVNYFSVTIEIVNNE